MARSLLLSEYARAKKALQEKLNSAENVTVSVDGWTSMGNQSVYACNVTFPDGSTALLDAKDLSDEMHTGLHIAGPCTDHAPSLAVKILHNHLSWAATCISLYVAIDNQRWLLSYMKSCAFWICRPYKGLDQADWSRAGRSSMHRQCCKHAGGKGSSSL